MLIFKIPNNVQIEHKQQILYIKGPLGNLSLNLLKDLTIKQNNKQLIIENNIKKNKKQYLNLYNSLIKNKIKGVTQGFKLNLFLKGIGFKFFLENNNKKLRLKLGFSHDIIIQIPPEIKITISKFSILTAISTDWLKLTQFIHSIRKYKKPEPYKGKGILLKNEIIIKKEGKKSKK